MPVLRSGTCTARNVSALPVAPGRARKVSRRKIKKPKRARKRKPDIQWSTPWMGSLPMTRYESEEKRLHDEILAFVDYVRPTRHETSARELVPSKVEEVIRRRFSSCSVTVYGSMAQESCSFEANMDLAVETSQVYQDSYRAKALFQLSSAFEQAQMITKFRVADGARVPVLSSETIPELGSLKLNICINSDEGVKAIPVIKHYLDEMPALRYLVLVIKAFLAQKGLDLASSGGLGSYATMCLVIHFLQANPGKRPVSHLEKPLENKSLGSLLMDFFDYYGDNFRYDADCISITTGSLIPKEVKGWNNEHKPDALSMECLLHPEHDIGKAASRIRQIRAAFQSAYDTLSLEVDHFSCNILGSVVGISDKTIAHRNEITRLVDSGKMEKRLDGLSLPPAYESPPNSPHVGHSLGLGQNQFQARDSKRPRHRYVERYYTEAQAPNSGNHWNYDTSRSSYSDKRKKRQRT